MMSAAQSRLIYHSLDLTYSKSSKSFRFTKQLNSVLSLPNCTRYRSIRQSKYQPIKITRKSSTHTKTNPQVRQQKYADLLNVIRIRIQKIHNQQHGKSQIVVNRRDFKMYNKKSARKQSVSKVDKRNVQSQILDSKDRDSQTHTTSKMTANANYKGFRWVNNGTEYKKKKRYILTANQPQRQICSKNRQKKQGEQAKNITGWSSQLVQGGEEQQDSQLYLARAYF